MGSKHSSHSPSLAQSGRKDLQHLLCVTRAPETKMKVTACLCAALVVWLAVLVSSNSLEPTPTEDLNPDSDALAPSGPNALSRNKRFPFLVVGVLASWVTAGAAVLIAKRNVLSPISTDDEFYASVADLTESAWDILHSSNITKRSGGNKKPKKGKKGRRPRTTPGF